MTFSSDLSFLPPDVVQLYGRAEDVPPEVVEFHRPMNVGRCHECGGDLISSGKKLTKCSSCGWEFS